MIDLDLTADQICAVEAMGAGSRMILGSVQRRPFVVGADNSRSGTWFLRVGLVDPGDLPGDLVNGYVERFDENGSTRTLKVPCKLKAIELDARLSGELNNPAPSVTIDLGSLLASLPEERQPFTEPPARELPSRGMTTRESSAPTP